MRLPVLLLAFALVTASCGALATWLRAPCIEHRHASGIAIVCSEDITPWTTVSEDFKGAFGFARELAEANADVFGYPAPDFANGAVVLRIVRPDAEPIAREWITSGVKVPAPKAQRTLPKPNVPVRLEPASRSVADLARIQHDVGPNLASLPDSDAIYQSGPDFERNMTRYLIDRESDALLRALAARYGTEALVVEVAPNPWKTGPAASTLTGP